jgi:hypothetical protein
MRHAFIKRVDKLSSERHSSAIELIEFKEVLLARCPVEWETQTQGIDIRNPDESTVNTGPRQGFHMKSEPGAFFHCYPYYGGIVIESAGREDVFDIITPVAEALKSRIFRM